MPPSFEPIRCPNCGAFLPERAPQGLCPKCLFAGLTASTGEEKIASPTPEQLAPHFPHLEIIACLGRGGMGVVYKARQKSLDRMVALKLLAPERVTDPAFAERFAREARALAKLSHPHIVTIHDFGEAGGYFYLLMEFVDGVNLRQAMKAGQFTPEQALAIVPPICEALQYAHDHGIVHRDIKPENLLLDRAGRMKIADFGIAKMLGADAGVDESQPAGTPQYMAPEQRAEPRGVDHRADIYSLGVVLYEMLTGELPAGRIEAPSRKVQVDVRIDEIVLRALERRPELRFATAADFRTQVEAAITGAAPPLPAGLRPRVLKMSGATLTTPEKLATFTGQFFHPWHSRGHLVLDESQLTFARGDAITVIPLAAIENLSIGEFPRSMNPAGLNLLSVTCDLQGEKKRVFISPLEGLFGFPSTWNENTAAWWSAIRMAVYSATGRMPDHAPASQLGVPSSSPWVLLIFLLPMLSALLLSTVLFNGASPQSMTFVFCWLIIGAFVILGFDAALALRKRFSTGGQKADSWRRWAWIVPLCSVAFFAAALWTGRPPPIGIWKADRISAESPGTGDVVVTVAAVSRRGNLVWVRLRTSTNGRALEMMPRFVATLTKPPAPVPVEPPEGQEIKQSVVLQLTPDKPPYEAFYSSRNVPAIAGPGESWIGFAMPGAEAAAAVVDQIARLHLNRPRGLNKKGASLLLFSLTARTARSAPDDTLHGDVSFQTAL